MSARAPVGRDAGELRRAFDEGFALPYPERGAASEDLLALRINGHPYALRVRELEGLHRAGKVVALPSPLPDLLGLAGIRGRLMPVFSLAALLGEKASSEGVARLALCDAGEPLALAFTTFDGHVRVAPHAIAAAPGSLAADGAAVGREHVHEVVSLEAGICPLVSVPSIIEVLRARTENRGR
jgi:chemotaxis signal transduction protein